LLLVRLTVAGQAEPLLVSGIGLPQPKIHYQS
jgi:hypothetical protein